jgi:hypothetical protein
MKSRDFGDLFSNYRYQDFQKGKRQTRETSEFFRRHVVAYFGFKFCLNNGDGCPTFKNHGYNARELRFTYFAINSLRWESMINSQAVLLTVQK